MPVALRAEAAGAGSSSSWARSRPVDLDGAAEDFGRGFAVLGGGARGGEAFLFFREQGVLFGFFAGEVAGFGGGCFSVWVERVAS